MKETRGPGIGIETLEGLAPIHQRSRKADDLHLPENNVVVTEVHFHLMRTCLVYVFLSLVTLGS